MHPPLKAYYLQQMGIETWVRRNIPTPTPLLNIIAPKSTQTTVMMILEGGEPDEANQWLAGKAGLLLKKMLHSIGLSSDNTAILCGLSTTVDSELQHRDTLLQAHIVRLKPQLILLLGPFSSRCLEPEDIRIPIVLSTHPTDLLNNPLKKKQVFSDLMTVKRLLGGLSHRFATSGPFVKPSKGKDAFRELHGCV